MIVIQISQPIFWTSFLRFFVSSILVHAVARSLLIRLFVSICSVPSSTKSGVCLFNWLFNCSFIRSFRSSRSLVRFHSFRWVTWSTCGPTTPVHAISPSLTSSSNSSPSKSKELFSFTLPSPSSNVRKQGPDETDYDYCVYLGTWNEMKWNEMKWNRIE